ncbi:hypothetical protein EON67_09915 [archaeon]|nr:MAG: hypothetical protein EON67_09915 [archaeon]
MHSTVVVPVRTRYKCRKFLQPTWHATRHTETAHAPIVTPVVDNWAAAWKVRRHWEDVTEQRKAAGKVIY